MQWYINSSEKVIAQLQKLCQQLDSVICLLQRSLVLGKELAGITAAPVLWQTPWCSCLQPWTGTWRVVRRIARYCHKPVLHGWVSETEMSAHLHGQLLLGLLLVLHKCPKAWFNDCRAYLSREQCVTWCFRVVEETNVQTCKPLLIRYC